jgi:beta-lactamase regulating signal transducer with metallopeptidase domain
MFSLLFGAGLVLLWGVFIVHQIWNVEINWGIAKSCLVFIQEKSIAHDATKVAADAFIFYTVNRMLLFAGKQWYQIRKWNREFHRQMDKGLTRKLNMKYRKLEIPFIVVNSNAFIALTIGLLRPKVVVSSWVFQNFSAQEAEAILLHEAYHYRHRDPLKMFILSLCKVGFGFVPLFRIFFKHYQMGKELLADQYAMDSMKSDFALSHVLLKLTKLHSRRISQVGVPFAAEPSINYRIMQVLEPGRGLGLPVISVSTIVISLGIFILISSFLIGGCS